MRTIFVLSLLACGLPSAWAQETAQRCEPNTILFRIAPGAFIECSLAAGVVHQYQFDPAAGEGYSLHLLRVGGTGTPCAQVNSDAFLPLLPRLCQLSLSIPTARPSLRIASPVRHTLLISAFGTGAVQYRLRFNRFEPPSPQMPLLEHGRVIRSAINPVGVRHWYQFVVEQGDRYSFSLDRLSGTGTAVMAEANPLSGTRIVASGSRRTGVVDGAFGLTVYEPGDDAGFEYALSFTCEGRCGREGLRNRGMVNAAHPRAAVCSGSLPPSMGAITPN